MILHIGTSFLLAHSLHRLTQSNVAFQTNVAFHEVRIEKTSTS